MGMFDEIKPIPVIRCPACHGKLSLFQTKDLEKSLDLYVEGKSQSRMRLPGKKYQILQYPKNTKVYAYDFCSTCQKAVGKWFQFNRQGVLKREDTYSSCGN